ncbi:MAG: hypothetical protein ACJ8H8_20615 [Geminicoccaceae bacterium]
MENAIRLAASRYVPVVLALAAFGLDLRAWPAQADAGAQADPGPAIRVNSTVPPELNPPFLHKTGGAPDATPAQAAAFAWQEFIALNWPAGPQLGKRNQRDTPSSQCRFGDPECTGPTVWETFRGKVEIFPGAGKPPGYHGDNGDPSFGYDALPEYHYQTAVPACNASQAKDAVPWVNLDETDQISLDSMYAGTVKPSSSPGNGAPQLVRFLAKGNRAEYVYVTQNSSPSDHADQWWYSLPAAVVNATKAFLAQHMASPPAGSSTMISLPYNTIEMKAGWRPLNPDEIASGRFHMQTVRFYEARDHAKGTCYRDATWGLVALHIIQKTPSAPYFIYATFEQADNIKTASGRSVEDVNGDILVQPPTATSPQECLVDPQPAAGPPDETPSTEGSVILTSNTATCKPVKVQTYCGDPGERLYFRNAAQPQPVPSDGNICVNRRINGIPNYAIAANKDAHAAIGSYLQKNKIKSAPWLYYALVNVQYYPYDKVITTVTPNGSPYQSKPPYTAKNPAPSSYYLANIVVETNRSLQLFSGGLSPAVATNWNADGTQHKNTYYGGHFYDMGGCMGCHGSQGQNRAGSAGDFSVILAKGHVSAPGIPAVETGTGSTEAERNPKLD